MTKSQKISGLSFTIIIGGVLILNFLKNKDIDVKLSQCTTYTAATITRIYTLRGFFYAEYNYKIGDKVFEVDEGVNDYDVTESWIRYRNQLLKRKHFFLKTYCADPKIHRIIWNVYVPDTLKRIPSDGWKIKPIWANESVD